MSFDVKLGNYQTKVLFVSVIKLIAISLVLAKLRS